MSKIQWTEKTWNPVRGCSRVSRGCEHCYAETMAARFSGEGQPYEGLAKRVGGEARWTGEVRFVPERLYEPLRRKKPTMYFVNSMSDLFHERLTDEQIAAVFGVMAACPQHTFQVLTKRPERMLKWFEWVSRCGAAASARSVCSAAVWDELRPLQMRGPFGRSQSPEELAPAQYGDWPLPHVWLGVSCEDQATADTRIPLLLQTPAAVRFVSAEPLLGPADLAWYVHEMRAPWYDRHAVAKGLAGRREHAQERDRPRLDWLIVGGESGPRARPCDVAWIRSIVEQCRDAGVPCFVKQLGAQPFMYNGVLDHYPLRGRDPKGGDPEEWPEDLRVREMPC